MVRFRLSHFVLPENAMFIPDYDRAWVNFDPDNPNTTEKKGMWGKAWGYEDRRDFVHRVNSKHIARYNSENRTAASGAYSTLAVIICFVIVACIIVPQIVHIFSALFFPSSRPPPTPPSPPQVPKNRKRLRFYHFRHAI